MPPKHATRVELSLASPGVRTENLYSPLGWLTTSLTRRSSVLQVDAIYQESEHDKEEDTADMHDDITDSLGNNWSKSDVTTQCRIAPMWKTMDELCKMLNIAIQHNTPLCSQNAKPIEANQEYRRESIQPESTNAKILHMAHPERHCSRANEFHNSRNRLHSTFQSHVRIFPYTYPNRV